MSDKSNLPKSGTAVAMERGRIWRGGPSEVSEGEAGSIESRSVASKRARFSSSVKNSSSGYIASRHSLDGETAI